MQHVQKIHRGRPERFDVLLYRLTGLERDQVELLIAMGGAYLDDLRHKQAGTLVGEGKRISAYWREPLIMEPVPFDESWVVHVDQRLLIAAKPVGLPTQGRRDADYLAFYELLKGRFPGYLALHHRLDQDTSGLMLFGRQRELNPDLARLFNEHLIQKTYLAVTRGPWLHGADSFVVDAPILASRDEEGTRQTIDPRGKPAQTELKLIAQSDGLNLLSCRPRTGRTHQIRVHLAHLGTPLWGDALYGEQGRDGFLLHCMALAWPKTGKLATGSWQLAPPPRWRELLPPALWQPAFALQEASC